MSFFSGYTFFVYLSVLLLPAIILGVLGKSLRWYRVVISAIFIYAVYKDTPKQLLYLVFYVLIATYLVKIYAFLRQKYGRNKYIYGHAVFFALLPLLVYKLSGVFGYDFFGFLGISYICFRVIQVVIETYDGVTKEVDEYQFIEFLLFFPSQIGRAHV